MECEENEIIRLEQEFRRDDHHFWYTPQNRSGMASHQKEWEEMRRKMQTEIELFSKEAAGDSPGLVEHLQAENRKRYGYREFLRKFSVLKEENAGGYGIPLIRSTIIWDWNYMEICL